MQGMIFKSEYLSNFECIFKNNLRKKLADKVGAFDGKQNHFATLVQVYLYLFGNLQKLFKGTLTRDILAFFIIFKIKSVFL
jgi:hypothetical protein